MPITSPMLAASTVLMVPPYGFRFNSETADSNAFQLKMQHKDTQKIVHDEFNNMVSCLKNVGLHVLLLKQNSALPDAVYPNNWFSTHIDSSGHNLLIIYPMLAKNRQAEVNIEGLMNLFRETNSATPRIIDLRNNAHQILEGTGSLVFDHSNRLVYAAESVRTTPFLVEKVASLLNYKPIIFTSVDEQNRPIYHTNVIMSITHNYIVICLDSVVNPVQKSRLLDSFKITQKTIIEISMAQVRHMCANILELTNSQGKSLLVLSTQALGHFTTEQLAIMNNHSTLVPVEIETIETIGGGGARCMMAELFLQPSSSAAHNGLRNFSKDETPDDFS